MLTLSKGTELKSRYVVDAVVGTGGSASVWKATDKQLKRDVALKRLLKENVVSATELTATLLAEAQKNAQLIHTNIVQVYDIFEEKGEHLLVLEFVDGQSLHHLLRDRARRGEPIPLDIAIGILRDALLGLSFAHTHNVCHRDLSPMNIMLTAQGVPKIADFGLARNLSSDADGSGSHTVQSQGGTGNHHFMSPEQTRGEPADTLSDLFMVGINGYLLLTGRHPYAHPSGLFEIPELLKDPNYSPEPPRSPSTMTSPQQRLFREYAAIVMKLLERERVGRFASAQEAIDAIEAVTPSTDCPKCGERVPDHHKFCGYCGSQLAPSVPVTVSRVDLSQTVNRTADELCEEGFQLSRRRNWDGAIEKYREALSSDANHLITLWNLGFVLNRIGRYSEANDVLTKAIDQGKPDRRSALHFERSIALSNQKDYDGALTDINESLRLQSDSAKAMFLRAQIHLYRGNIDEALIDAKQVVKWVPDHTGALRLIDDLDLYR